MSYMTESWHMFTPMLWEQWSLTLGSNVAGESHVDDHAYLVDHHGVSYMLHHVAKVWSITPSSSGLLGGMCECVRMCACACVCVVRVCVHVCV